MKITITILVSFFICWPELFAQPSAAYHNMEKYWWYRYRLVNDFMYIDPTDSVGSSLPAQRRDWYNNDGEFTPSSGYQTHDGDGNSVCGQGVVKE